MEPMAETLSLFPVGPQTPSGFGYAPCLISRDEEASILQRVSTLPFTPFDFRGFKGSRQTVAFGSRYDFTRGHVQVTAPIPDWLEPLKCAAAAFGQVPEDELVQALITEYRPGAGIGWHRDRPEYGKVIGVSFASPCILRLRQRDGDRWRRMAAPLEPTSAYLLDGEVRDGWQHSISPGERLRYSVTFRTVR